MCDVEDVRRKVKMLKALSGHTKLVKFYVALEDVNEVYDGISIETIIPQKLLLVLICFCVFLSTS